MIKAVLIFNNDGKPRLTKFYDEALRSIDEQQQIIRECHLLVQRRAESACNFLESGKRFGKDTKLVYRHYATLYFMFCVDTSESELGCLDLIQVFVESLDKSFAGVCELDLIFHMDIAQYVLDEIVMGGMVLETNVADIAEAIEEQKKTEKQEGGSGLKGVLDRVQR
eukprot:CAMPEP_0114626522 /NCGR_PEP_ID=MMETSP0168-20121206/11825_1 /TAXON_ID=95228 ORGANISM="Vannella sp., Strain DIVA3 517/6/12" /NCGR_SAMPLE_ID=MMETSP0168 /ASSEMBLY_ACC=CAM_ASM_000044 /LENGTH=166 /DNA_ID=CAMNT_0001837829 /DNA_START=37 /DNA_END=537 /DNA_ORIENTATION=-